MEKTKNNLLQGSILRQLWALTWPGIGGALAITLFNLTDTFFVSRLGTEALAAMGFTFPVVRVIGSIAMGISVGSGSVLSRAMGAGNHYRMKRTATDGIYLSLLIVALVSLAGILSLDTLFRLMGATGEVLQLVKDYMFIWYAGSLVVIMPPVSDSCLRATGDMIRPLIVMLVCAVMNALLDPIFIFGLWGFPAMGIRGAALATVISRTLGMFTTLGFLHFHAGLLDGSLPGIKELFRSWKEILHVGMPAAFTQLLPPLTRGILTRLATVGGAAAVAALAVGTRIESFSLILVLAYSMALVPMIGQNWGGRQWKRIKKVQSRTLQFALIYGLGIFLVTLLVAKPVSKIFSSDPEVIPLTLFYLVATAFSIGGAAYALWTTQTLNASGHPLAAMRMNGINSFLILIPLSLLGTYLYKFPGLVIGFSTGQLLASLVAFYENRRLQRKMVSL